MGGGGGWGHLWPLHHRGRVQTPVAGSCRACLVLGCKRDARPQGGGDGEEGVPVREEGRVLLQGGQLWLCRNHWSCLPSSGQAVLGWRGHTWPGPAGDRGPGDCAGTDLCPPRRAAPWGGKRVSPARGITPKCPKGPIPSDGRLGCSRGSVLVQPWPWEGLTAAALHKCVGPRAESVSVGQDGSSRGATRSHRTGGQLPPARPSPMAGRCCGAAYIKAGRWQRAGSWARSIYSGRRANTTAGTF